MPGSKRVPRAQREELILDAATAEFGRYGHAGASLSAIAAGAGVSKQLVLGYFGSKDALFAACADRAGASIADRIDAVLAAGGPPLTLAEGTLAAIFTALAPRPHDWNVLNDRTTPAGSAAHRAARTARVRIAEQARSGVGTLAALDAVADADDLEILTDIWMGSVSALVGWWLRHPDRSAAEMTERGRRALLALSRTPALDEQETHR
ncbi:MULTISPECIES: TetR/AcrR family transcriptional regulator [Pimelobacter]|uniref:TetR/AcrR family transcriptional regulator n=1 Tax=Pimelobacter TaxID=2044 RepID=UPI001C048A2C|nr:MULTISPECIES: helix-turn-helix domain-containing protein [Pimelobacter]MBU2697361.1 TetR family transcriptional regulator [Pimelobacter sp. 30-1]UUW88074.1 TetR/AcrR family transcriptional regulator [Pimelobacter simplex]UUW97578.1 TetR/AcrR family transcriptional regulator [Pimelobacter simplex]